MSLILARITNLVSNVARQSKKVAHPALRSVLTILYKLFLRRLGREKSAFWSTASLQLV